MRLSPRFAMPLFQPLEQRRLLSLSPGAPSYNALHDAPLIVDATYGVLAGAIDSSGAPLSASLVDGPRHGAVTLQPDGSFRYDPEPNFQGRDSFAFEESNGAGLHHRGVAQISVLNKWVTSTSATRGGVQPFDTPPEKVSVSSARGPEGVTLHFIASVSGTGPDGDAFGAGSGQPPLGPNQRYADMNADFEPFGTGAIIYGSGSFTVDVQTEDDERDVAFDGFDAVLGVLVANTDANNIVSSTGTGTIYERGGAAPPCICSCSCGNVEPGDPSLPTTNGRPTANTGQGAQPGDLYYVGAAEPHPIATADDTLSGSVAQASDIMVQTTLDDLAGNVLYAAPAVYYSPAGYSAGQQVQFSQQLDASGLTDGAYQSTTTITEEYSGGALPVTRGYVSTVDLENRDNSPYGSGWGLKNIDRLIPQPNGVSVEDGSGNLRYFASDGSGGYELPDNWPDAESLVQNGDGSFSLTFRNQTIENFNAAGQLLSSTNKDGNMASFQWNSDGTLASTTNQSGQVTSFAYSNGQLTSVTDFAGRVTGYGYTGAQLTSISAPAPGNGEQQHVTSLTYDPTTGMLSTITDAGGTTTLAYNTFRQVASITAPDGTCTQYAAPSSLSLVDTSTGLGTQSDPAPLVYTTNIEGSVTDGNNHTSTYTVDAATGQTLSTTDATGVTTAQYEYNDAAQVTSIVQPPVVPGGAALTTTLYYDANGNLDERDLPDGTKETWTFDQTWNEPTVYVDPAGRETDYTLDPANGDVVTVTQVGQNGDANLVTNYTYTPIPTAQGQTPGGLVATMIDPRGIETDFSYNAHGLVTSIVYAVGTADQASVSMTYDQNDNPASFTNELGQTTLFVFDNSDRKIEEQQPPPDPNQPNVRPTLTWSYDTRGNMLDSVNALNQETQYVYGPGSDGDEPDLDKLIQPDPAGGTNYTITTYGHDNADNVTSILDPMSRLETIGLDADNRQTSITLPNPNGGGSGGPTESVVLNALGFPVQQFDLDGGETDNTFNWRGQVLTTTGPAVPDGHGGQVRPTETLTYNADGQTLTDQNPLLATTQYVYDSFGRLSEEILPDPDGSGPLTSPTLHWGYDANSNVTSFQDASGNVYHYVYSARNQLIEEDDPSPDGGHTPGPVWHWVHDAAMQLTAMIDPMSRETQFVHDGDGNVIQTIAPNLTTGGPGDASTTTFDTYDLASEKTSETTPNGGTTTWQHDDLGRTTTTTQPVPATGEAAPVWQDFYDADSELTKVINPIGLAQTSTFNGLGQMTSQTSFAGVEIAWTYNNLSEILTETVGTGSLAQTTTNTWDALGRKTAVQDANGTTQMAFDLAGRMTSLTDPDNNETVWTRDNLGRVTAEQNPSGTENFSYDTNSNLTKQVDFDGHERDFVFDDLNRETAEKWMAGGTATNTIATAYNADGQVTSTGDNFSAYAFGYNGQGDQTSVDNAGTPGAPHVVLASGYDTQGNRTSLAASINGTADFLNNYSFDALSRLRNITQQGQSGGNAVAPKSIYIGLNGVGDITELDFSNSVTQGPQQNGPGYATLSYSGTTGLLTGIDDFAGGTSIDNLAYTYDPLARVSTFTSIDGTGTFGYDHASQLVSATYTTSPGGHQPNNVAFSWDSNGNNNATGNVVSPNNEVTNDGTFTYQFDADGNRTVRTRISNAYAADFKTVYTWDYRNRLTDVEFYDNNGVLTKHVHDVYDVYDNLIEEDIDPNGGGAYTTKEQFALDVTARPPSAGNAPLETFDASGDLIPSLPDDVLMELVNGQLAQRFLNGPSPSGAADVIYAEGAVDSLIQPDTTRWVFVNNQGSPTDVVNSSGTLIDHQVYSAFGQVVYVSNAGVFVIQGFSGGIADANTGDIRFGERWYDPTASVWLSSDPAGLRCGSNLTAYVHNIPTNAFDPQGMYQEAMGAAQGKSQPWWNQIQGLTPDQQLLLYAAEGDLETEMALLNLFAVVHQADFTIASWAQHTGSCHAWANAAYADIIEEQMVAGLLPNIMNQGLQTYKYIGIFPLWWDHSFIKLSLHNGLTFYVDNGYLGGADHIFFDLPSTIVSEDSPQYQDYCERKREAYANPHR